MDVEPKRGKDWKPGDIRPIRDSNNKPTGEVGKVVDQTYTTPEGSEKHFLTLEPIKKSEKPATTGTGELPIPKDIGNRRVYPGPDD